MQEFIDYLNRDPVSRGTLLKSEADPFHFSICHYIRRAILNECDSLSFDKIHLLLLKDNQVVDQLKLFKSIDYPATFEKLLKRDEVLLKYIQFSVKTPEQTIYRINLPPEDEQPVFGVFDTKSDIIASKDINKLVKLSINTLNYRGEDISLRAIKALNILDAGQTVKLLIQALRFGRRDWRAKVPYALARFVFNTSHELLKEEVIDALIWTLQEDEISEIRGKAAWALGFAFDKSVIPPLVLALRDNSAEVRVSSVKSLGLLYAKPYSSLIYWDRQDDTFYMEPNRNNSTLSLSRKVLSALLQTLQDQEAEVRANAALALGQIAEPQSDQSLTTLLLSDQEAEVRASAALALGQIADIATIEPLRKALFDEDATVRQRVVQTLASIRNPTVIDSLSWLLRTDKSNKVREQVAIALGLIGSNQAIKPLIEALGDSDGQVQLSAVTALGRVGNSQVIPKLLEVLEKNSNNSTEDTMFKLVVTEAISYIKRSQRL